MRLVLLVISVFCLVQFSTAQTNNSDFNRYIVTRLSTDSFSLIRKKLDIHDDVEDLELLKRESIECLRYDKYLTPATIPIHNEEAPIKWFDLSNKSWSNTLLNKLEEGNRELKMSNVLQIGFNQFIVGFISDGEKWIDLIWIEDSQFQSCKVSYSAIR